ncbi:MAG: hypothetical protein P8180_16660, partial [Gammaproteobacteria bacterium]
MKKCLKFALTGVAAGALALGYAAPAAAITAGGATLTATTVGQVSASADSMGNVTLTPGFYTITYSGEVGPSITSITYDLSNDIHDLPGGPTSSVFNFDTGNLGTSGPSWVTSGLSNGSVDYSTHYTSTDNAHNPSSQPNQLTFSFGAGTFQVNDTFSFGTGAEWVNGDQALSSNGLDFGLASIPLTVTFSNGTKRTANFAPDSSLGAYGSSLSIIAPASGPLPGAVWLFGSGLVGLAG